MSLTLRAVSLNDQPITKPITAHCGPAGGSIGRADTNTLALPDPERRISRRQAEIVATDDGFLIKNDGSANPIIVRDESLALGDSALLRQAPHFRREGDTFLLCGDGWWGPLEDELIATALARASGPDDWLAAMQEIIELLAAPRQDNFSAIAVWVRDPIESTRPVAKG